MTMLRRCLEQVRERHAQAELNDGSAHGKAGRPNVPPAQGQVGSMGDRAKTLHQGIDASHGELAKTA